MTNDEEGNVVDLNTRILTSIRDEIVRMRTELREEISSTRSELREEISVVGGRIATLEAETIRGFTAVRHEIDGLGRRIDKTNERVGHVADRVDHLTERVDHLTERVDQLGERAENTNERLDRLIELHGTGHRDHDARITRLETVVAALRPRRPRA